jgi:tRNA1(Val) A37 N6-methylase TrmN6
LLQDEDAYKAIVVGYDELIEKFMQEARDLLKQSAKLEFSTRKKLLSDEIIKSLKKIAVNISTQEFVRNNRLTEPTRFILNKKKLHTRQSAST